MDERKKLKGLADMAKGVDPTNQPVHLEKSPSTWSRVTEGQRPVLREPSDLSAGATKDESTLRSSKDEAADLAALDADLARLEKEARAAAERQAEGINAKHAGTGGGGGTISAPAMTAEELAAQDREEKSAQRGRRDVEQEDEREEAATRLQDEFEEMQGYEDRVKRLRERREMLKNGVTATSTTTAGIVDGAMMPPGAAVDASTTTEGIVDGAMVPSAAGPGVALNIRPLGLDGDGDNEDEDEEDYDDWSFGKR